MVKGSSVALVGDLSWSLGASAGAEVTGAAVFGVSVLAVGAGTGADKSPPASGALALFESFLES